MLWIGLRQHDEHASAAVTAQWVIAHRHVIGLVDRVRKVGHAQRRTC
jgi:hypothetical protein